MLQPEFTFDVEPERHLMRVRLAGFFDDAAITRYVHARNMAFLKLRSGPNQHLSLIDVRGMAIQTQDVVVRWKSVLADPVYLSRRLAFVVASTLARMQLQRAIGSRDAQCFLDELEAERWLLDGVEANVPTDPDLLAARTLG